MKNEYFNSLIQKFNQELDFIKNIILDTLFDNVEEYQKLYTELYNEVLVDYNYRNNRILVNLGEYQFFMRVNSFIVHMILWKPFLYFNNVKINSDFIINTSKINADIIAEYLDLVIKEFITDENQYKLNNIISEIREELSWISLDFNPTVGNTINLYDKIQLAKRNERYNDLIHTKLDVDNLSMDEIEHEMSDKTNELISILKTEDNCFKDYLGAGEGVNRDQLTQFEIVIG